MVTWSFLYVAIVKESLPKLTLLRGTIFLSLLNGKHRQISLGQSHNGIVKQDWQAFLHAVP
jgi:hypothetical protein